MTKPAQPRYRLELQAQPGPVDPVLRLRRVLKALLRAYGFRAVFVEEIRPSASPDQEAVEPTQNASGGELDAAKAIGE